jgi:hypothetical protein
LRLSEHRRRLKAILSGFDDVFFLPASLPGVHIRAIREDRADAGVIADRRPEAE